MKTYTITTEHFDKAIALPWSTQTCIVSQLAMEQGEPKEGVGSPAVRWTGGLTTSPFWKVATQFDVIPFNQIDGWDKAACAEFRAKLPITVEVAE